MAKPRLELDDPAREYVCRCGHKRREHSGWKLRSGRCLKCYGACARFRFMSETGPTYSWDFALFKTE